MPAGRASNGIAPPGRDSLRSRPSGLTKTALMLFLFVAMLPRASGQVYLAGGPGGPPAASYTLSGTVINSVTGDGVPYALVQVMDRAQLTGPEGEFRFEGLPAAEVTPYARKPGFFNAQERADRSGGSWRQDKTVKLGPDTQPVILKLLPEGVVSGVVTGTDGEPVEGVTLVPHFQQIMNGRRQWEFGQATTSNEDGEFRIANLLPGTYFLSARPQPKRVVRGRQPRQSDEGYAPVFYSAAPDLASATPIVIQPGARADVSLSLQIERTFRVSGRISGYDLGQGVSLQLKTPSGDEVPMDINLDPPSGAFEASMVPAGSYILRAFASRPSGRWSHDPGQSLLAELPLQIRGDVSNVHLVLQPAPMIPVVVRQEFTNSQERPEGVSAKLRQAQLVSVRLLSLDRRNSDVFARFNGPPETSPFVLADAEPGKYRVEITPNGPWYVASAQFGGTDLAHEDLVIYPGASQPLEVVVRDDAASLDVSLQSDESETQGTVLIVPDRRLAPPQLRNARMGDVGRFGGLAPGDYRVFAFDDISGLEYMNADVMREYFPKSARITLQANDRASVHLELIHRGEP